MLGGDIVNKLKDQDRFAHASAAEQADLAALGIGRQEVDDLDTGLKNLRYRPLLGEGRGIPMDGHMGCSVNGTAPVDGLAQHVQRAGEQLWADGNGDRRAGILHEQAPGKALRGLQRYAAHRARQMLHHLTGHLAAVLVIQHIDEVVDRWNRVYRKGYI